MSEPLVDRVAASITKHKIIVGFLVLMVGWVSGGVDLIWSRITIYFERQAAQSRLVAQVQSNTDGVSAIKNLLDGGILPGAKERTDDLQKQIDDIQSRHRQLNQLPPIIERTNKTYEYVRKHCQWVRDNGNKDFDCTDL